MNKITKYNKIVEEIVWDFVKRVFKELTWEEEPIKNDYRIMDYQWINQGPVEVFDRYFCLSDIIICEAYQIPTKILFDYCDEELDAYMKDETLWINFYNYAMKDKDYKKVRDKVLQNWIDLIK